MDADLYREYRAQTGFEGYSSRALDHTYRPRPLPPREFKYERLPDKRRSIRLLKLFPSYPENPQIECEFILADVGSEKLTKLSPAGYEVLSWSRDPAQQTQYIHIRQNGPTQSKRVQPDLVAALKMLRHSQDDRYLWIDAICINQEDVTEKNHQVEMMSSIYGQAERVCVWLGDGDLNSAIAFRFIQREVLQLENFDELCESNDASRKWAAVLELMQRPWFSRIWAVQEIALARDIIIYCGADQIPWKDFAVAVELFVEVETATNRLSEVMKKDPRFYNVPGWFEHVSTLGASLLVQVTSDLFRDTRSTRTASSAYDQCRLAAERVVRQPLLSLEYLVSSLSIFDVSIDHDSIYSLLSIARDTTPVVGDPDLTAETEVARSFKETSGLLLDRTMSRLEFFTQRKRYKVAYELPYADTCITFIKFCIEQADPRHALDILCRPWARTEVKTRPESYFYDNQLMSKASNVQLPSWVSQLSGAPYGMYSHPGVHIMRMGRKNADTLVGLNRNYAASETTGIDKKTLRFKKRILHNTHFSLYTKGFILDTIEKVFPASQGGAIPQEWIDAVGWTDVDKTDPPDEFWRTLVADRGRDGRNPPLYYSRACKSSFLKGGLPSGSISTSELINKERSSVIAQFCRRVQAVIWNRSLIKTKSGVIGLASKNSMSGDLVCILYGCSVPIILRQCAGKKTLQELAQEREEDFVNTVIEVQRRWKRRFERNRRVRMIIKLRVIVGLMTKRSIHVDPILRFYIARKYGMRWRRIVRARAMARARPTWEEMEAEMDARNAREGRGAVGEGAPTTPESDGAEGLHTASQVLDNSESAPHAPIGPLKSREHPPPQMPQSIKLSQTTEASFSKEDYNLYDEYDGDRSNVDVARAWAAKLQAWLTRLPEGRESDEYYHYQFLGEAYVHKMMDGEAMEYQNVYGIKKRLFELR